jgi:uncharacterized protein (TIGR00251 family)
LALKRTSDGVTIDVVVRPKSSRNEIAGRHGDRLKIKLTAPPADGKANAALISFLAKKLGVPKSSVEIVRGQTSRIKTVRISGIAEAEAKQILFTH